VILMRPSSDQCEHSAPSKHCLRMYDCDPEPTGVQAHMAVHRFDMKLNMNRARTYSFLSMLMYFFWVRDGYTLWHLHSASTEDWA
jgi:hypothetical protein